ncbi:MAG: glycosyltransferase [Terriglobales bacterium]
MRLLMVTYPLTPVTPTACGGTEQVAFQLLRAWSRRSDFSLTWIGAAGSWPLAGVDFLSWDELLERGGQAPPGHGPLSPAGLELLRQRWSAALARFQQNRRWDLLHDQGALGVRLKSAGAPLLRTLHLARPLYPDSTFQSPGREFHLQCVSRTQYQLYGERACCGWIGNGIDLSQFPARSRAPGPGAPLVFLGRICPEKAPHEAIAVARAARRRLWIVGAVAPFPSHQEYFHRLIAPALDGDIAWLPPPSLADKRTLLAEAAAVLIPSRIAETSSLVAMEAAASGVPVLATPSGALPEIVADGESGWLGSSADFPAFLQRLDAIDARACRRRAQRLFSADLMVAAYAALYRRLVG